MGQNLSLRYNLVVFFSTSPDVSLTRLPDPLFPESRHHVASDWVGN